MYWISLVWHCAIVHGAKRNDNLTDDWILLPFLIHNRFSPTFFKIRKGLVPKLMLEIYRNEHSNVGYDTVSTRLHRKFLHKNICIALAFHTSFPLQPTFFITKSQEPACMKTLRATLLSMLPKFCSDSVLVELKVFVRAIKGPEFRFSMHFKLDVYRSKIFRPTDANIRETFASRV